MSVEFKSARIFYCAEPARIRANSQDSDAATVWVGGRRLQVAPSKATDVGKGWSAVEARLQAGCATEDEYEHRVTRGAMQMRALDAEVRLTPAPTAPLANGRRELKKVTFESVILMDRIVTVSVRFATFFASLCGYFTRKRGDAAFFLIRCKSAIL